MQEHEHFMQEHFILKEYSAERTFPRCRQSADSITELYNKSSLTSDISTHSKNFNCTHNSRRYRAAREKRV